MLAVTMLSAEAAPGEPDMPVLLKNAMSFIPTTGGNSQLAGSDQLMFDPSGPTQKTFPRMVSGPLVTVSKTAVPAGFVEMVAAKAGTPTGRLPTLKLNTPPAKLIGLAD